MSTYCIRVKMYTAVVFGDFWHLLLRLLNIDMSPLLPALQWESTMENTKTFACDIFDAYEYGCFTLTVRNSYTCRALPRIGRTRRTERRFWEWKSYCYIIESETVRFIVGDSCITPRPPSTTANSNRLITQSCNSDNRSMYRFRLNVRFIDD